MQFRLTYEGPLPSTQDRNPDAVEKASRVKLKHSMRQVFHRQLGRLWEQRQFLSRLYDVYEPYSDSFVDRLARTHGAYGFDFVPLATEADEIDCHLNVLLLRPGPPGGVISTSGDIDNRLKTLFDALRKPRNAGEVGEAKPEADESPFYVLLEDDGLISRVSVEADTLLEPVKGHPVDGVRLVVTVDVRCVGKSNFLRFL